MEALTNGISGEIDDLETENTNLVIRGLESGVEYSITGYAHGSQSGQRSLQYEIADSTRKMELAYRHNFCSGSID